MNTVESIGRYFENPAHVGRVTQLTILLGGVGLAAILIAGAIGAQEVESKGYIEVWSSKIRAQLAGNESLGEGERLYERLVVVPAAPTLEQRVEMVRRETPVNVRNFPSTYLPNGTDTQVLGQIAPGIVVQDVLWIVGKQPNSPVAGNWGAFRCDTVQGVVWRPETVGNLDGRICTIYGDYLQAFKPVGTAPQK